MTNAIANMLAQSEVAANIAAADKAAAETAKAASKSKRSTRTAQKPVEVKAESVVVKTAKVLPVKFKIHLNKPTSGADLFAYTCAWMEVLGMFKGATLPQAILEDDALGGKTMVAWHLSKGNLEEKNGQVGLSAKGMSAFAPGNPKRKFDKADKDIFIAIMKTGKSDGRLVKLDSSLKAVTLKA